MPLLDPDITPEGPARTPRRTGRSLFATMPIAIASSVAVTLNLITPANAVAADTGETERLNDKAPEATGTTTADLRQTATTSQAQASTAAAPAHYRVQHGDTVSGIAGRFGLSTASVLALNGLSWKSLIFPGQVLALTGATGSSHHRAAPTAPVPSATKYRVVSGDTISGIAGRFGVSTAAVLSANGLGRSSLIFPGQLITVPGLATAAVETAHPVASSPTHPAAPSSRSGAAGIVPLTPEMRANARIIVEVGRQKGVDDYGLVIALAAAAQESGLRNVRHGDRDSLGLFQQRPSTGWGTPAQVLDPHHAARAFFGGPGNPNAGRTRGLLDIRGWHSMSVTAAAQAVQISAYPTAYAKWERSARAWLSQLG